MPRSHSRPARLVTFTTLGASSLATVALLAGCGEEKKVEVVTPIAPETYVPKEKFDPRDTGGKAAPAVAFADATAASGIAFTHVSGARGKKYLPETMGAGVAMLDYDADGKQDLFFLQGAEWPDHASDPAPTCKLYKNLGGMKFEDVTQAAGCGLSLIGMGATAADYDGDGDADLFITALGPNHLLRNDGGKFVDVTEASGLKTTTWTDKQGRVHPAWSTSAAWVDYDCDGVLDLFVCGYVHWSIENDVLEMLGSVKAYTIPTKYEADSCRLWRGKGDGSFEDVTERAGILRKDSKALGVAVADVNGDGRPDFAVSNDTEPNYLFVSQPDGRYSEMANEAGIAFDEIGRARAGMGIDACDVCNDGKLVISIGNFSKEPIAMYTQTGDKIFFIDRAGAARVATPTNLSLTFAVVFCDYDLDGCHDILVCNGHIEPEIQSVQKDVAYEQPTQLFWNRGDGTFADVSAKSGEVFTRPVVARGATSGDLDGDGDLDFVMTQNGRAAIVMRNDQALKHRWLRIRPRGTGKNRDAIGAVVTLTTGGKTLRRDVRTGSSYLSQCDIAATFGLGSTTETTATVEVRWPSGKRERFADLALDREHVVTEGQGTH